jgi:dTDP-4-dehydrorhamnose 3,5-epimerase
MTQTIHDVDVKRLRRIEDPRGPLFHMLRADDADFTRFGEIYFTMVHEAAVKAWRRHSRMTMHCAVPVGRVRFVLFDDRETSPSRGRVMKIITGIDDYALVTVPPGIWNGFQGLGPGSALIANCADLPHDPNESQRRDANDSGIPYSWA